MLSINKLRAIAACVVLLFTGAIHGESQVNEDRILKLELALKQLAEQNARLASEVEDLKRSIHASSSSRSTSVLDDAPRTAPPVDGVAKLSSSSSSQTVSSSAPVDPNELKLRFGNGLKFQTADGETWKGEVGGRFHWDVSGYDEDRDVEALVGDVNGGTEFRRLRLSSEGEFGLAAPLYYKVDVDFAGNDSVMKDVYVGFKNLPLIGDIRLGHIKEPFSMEELGSSKHMGYVERASLNEALVPSRNNGVQISDTAFDDRMGWAAGWFAEVDQTNINEIDGNHHFTGRLFGVPYLSEDEQRPSMWHVGMAGSYANIQDDTSRHRARPEGHLAPRLVDTGNFSADSYYLGGLETAFVHGSFSVQAEYVHNQSNLVGGGNADFAGWYAYGSWFLTGESRVDAYKPKLGFYDRIKPKRNFSITNGGLGAWELTLRYSNLDLNDGSIMGGEMDVVTAGLNWYLSPSVRAIFNYGIAYVERNDSQGILRDGAVDMAQFRFLVNF